MKATIFISGRITKGETLVDVIRQFKSFENPSEVTVEIKSNGGNKEEGEDIYNYLKNIDAEIPVTTKTEKAYSIAAKIFAAGSTRIVSDKEEVIGVHFARVTPKGDFTAEQLEELTEQLFEIKQEFIDFYSEHLNIDKGTVEALLENETVLSGEKAVEIGFATEVEKAAEIVAELYIENSNFKTMTEKKKKEKGFFKKMLADIQAYLEEDGGEVTAELTLQDSNATDIVFPDLESGDTPKVGDKATVDGSAIPDGSYVMPSLEDATVVFVDGAISEIIPKEDATSTETVAEKNKGKGKKKAEVKAEEVLTITTWKMNVVNTSFAEGDTVTYIDWDDNEQTLSNSEFVLSDGRSVVTDAAGVIVKIKEANSPEQVAADNTTETQANFEELLEKMTEKVTKKVTDEIKADFEAELEKKDKEITSLKKGKSSKEIIAEEKENLAKDNKEKGAARYLSAANNL